MMVVMWSRSAAGADLSVRTNLLYLSIELSTQGINDETEESGSVLAWEYSLVRLKLSKC